MLVGLNLVFYYNSPSGKQRNLSATRQNSEALDYYDSYFYEVNDWLEKYNNTKIWPILGTKISTD
jgi:hypothetical protein